ncbi:hypothetical protein BPAE_0412g00050 [Botrytis paeoniae]|uniref:Uncharacterized protein n=1 Tax=Botrytis paeoniae TaxID=278948 RepID=A0A4Z1F4E3_9HELO|nr:hypothetical protein BPAE_0412g00050 [Botrytis paeoniae]
MEYMVLTHALSVIPALKPDDVLVVMWNKTSTNDPKFRKQIEANTSMDIPSLAHKTRIKNNDQ